MPAALDIIRRFITMIQDELTKGSDLMSTKKSLREIYTENIREFAELNLQLTKQCKETPARCISTELLKELRENAQTLRVLTNVRED